MCFFNAKNGFQKVYKIAVYLFTVKNLKGDFLEAVKNITRLFGSICHSISKIIENKKWSLCKKHITG